MASHRSCLICTAPSNYANYGVNSCRSCADFFQRSMDAKRPFLCRQGGGICDINPNNRHNCRGCRIQRCRLLGMKRKDEPPTDLQASLKETVRDQSQTFALQPATPRQNRQRSRAEIIFLSMSSQRSCLICTAPSVYTNYGVKSCRSCADFFKRTMTAGRTLQCKKGDGKCAINPHDRHNCRACRMDKCTALGMTLPCDNIYDQFPTISSSLKARNEICSAIFSPKQNLVENAQRFTRSRFIDHTMVYECDTQSSTTPLLDKIRKGFSFMCLIRMKGEMKFNSREDEQIRLDNISLSLSNYSTMVPIHEFLREGLLEFANIAFVQFRTRDSAIKDSIVERRLTCMDLLESTYRTCHHFPNDKETRMPGYTTYFKNSDIERVFANCQDDVDKPKLMSEWKKSVIQLSRMVRYHFEEMKPTEYEFLALLGLTFWRDEYANRHLQNIAREIESEILWELHKYYTAIGKSDYANRIGKIFCLVMNCQASFLHECSVKVDEDFEVYRLMNMFEYAFRIE